MRRFEWDATKDRTNQRKHGFGFRTAARVFEDPDIVLMEDRVDEEGEQRWQALGMVGGRFLLVVVQFTERLKMAKRSSGSSRPARQISMKAESIFDKPLTARQQQALDRLAAKAEAEIDYSDIPPLSEEQLASAFRPKSKQLIAVRLDRDVLSWLKQYGSGYSTRINAILRAAMTARRSA
jgi:uncharacterized protein (DUF4415 family)